MQAARKENTRIGTEICKGNVPYNGRVHLPWQHRRERFINLQKRLSWLCYSGKQQC
jgi:hypothetical protein